MYLSFKMLCIYLLVYLSFKMFSNLVTSILRPFKRRGGPIVFFMVTSTFCKFGRVTYKLQPPPYEIIRYILHEACRHVEYFCDGALALYTSESPTDMVRYTMGIRNVRDKMINSTTLFTLLNSISTVVSEMKLVTEALHKVGDIKNLIRSNRDLYYVYVVGFVDICITMDGGNTKIDQMCEVELQVKGITNRIKQYPHMLNWVETSIEDWDEGLEMCIAIQQNPKYNGMISQVWYMLSPRKNSTLQSLTKYHEEGHGFDEHSLGDVMDEVMCKMDECLEDESTEHDSHI